MESLNIISLGLGVQSTAMYYMSCIGELPRADYAIFADTGGEKSGTLRYLDYLQKWRSENLGIDIIVISKKNLKQDILQNYNSTNNRLASIPAFTKNDDGSAGMLRRQCTNEYKIEQIDKEIRALYSLQKHARTPKTTIWKGITLDEIERMSIPMESYKTNFYPFCGYYVTKQKTLKFDVERKTRNDLINWYNKHGLPIPPKSSCKFCPYMSDAAWYDMKVNEPDDFIQSIEIDEKLRDACHTKIKQPAFLHRSLKPLAEIDFKQGEPDLWSGECSGNCHV